MAISKSANTYNRLNWEQSEFPILCQTCLGDNPYLRMLKDNFGDECKVCSRPFTVFRWCPGAKMRYKRTEICQVNPQNVPLPNLYEYMYLPPGILRMTGSCIAILEHMLTTSVCAQLKNVCQTCLLDLEYGLPVQVRDHALKIKDDIPKSDVNKEYYIQNTEKELADAGRTEPGGLLGKSQAPSDLLLKLARTTPYYKRNRPHVCSFWVKGECKRGEECPYRHEMPTDPSDPLSQQNIKDRYYGANDPVAEKLLGQAKELPQLVPPEDKGITSLYVGGLGDTVTEKDLRDHFYQFGEIENIHVITKQNCAFITYTTRPAAEKAVEESFNKLIIKGNRLKVLWGRSQGLLSTSDSKGGGTHLSNVPGLPEPLPPPSFDPLNLKGVTSTPPPPPASSDIAPPPPPPQGHPKSGLLPPPPAPPQYQYAPPPPPPGAPPQAPGYYRHAPHVNRNWEAPLPPGPNPPPQIFYPSQDPHHLGSRAHPPRSNI